MDLIEAIRRELGFIKVKKQPEVESALQELRGNLARALNSLSDELYSKAIHFLLEFIQNADDNRYGQGAKPTLKISLEPQWLVIQCNEVGFEAANVRALCKIGASTKANKEGYIGEKGIGFKAVFRITDVVYVLSREYSFYFDRTQELGMIAPIWTNKFPVEKGWTTFRLQLPREESMQYMREHLSHLQPSLLLFLRKLRHVRVTIDGETSQFNRRDVGSDIVLDTVHGSSCRSQRYLVVNHSLATYDQEPKRVGIKESVLVLAFPLTMDEEPVLEDQAVYAFLPLRNYGFQFIVQGDFLTPSSREDILSDLRWNIVLRDGIPKAFVQAVTEFRKRVGTQFRWLRFIPEAVSDGFMKPVQSAIIEALKTEPVILGSDGEYHLPTRMLMKPMCGSDGNPLIPVRFLKGRFYLSLEYDLGSEKTSLALLGVRDMTSEDLLGGLGEMYYQVEFLKAQPDEWHESVCMRLLEILEVDSSQKWSMRSLKIIPLRDGSWSTSWLADLHFCPSADAPLDLNFSFVRPIDQQSARYRLFQKLGITEATPQAIAERILKTHSHASVDISRANLLAHVRYLFDHRLALEDVLTERVELWVTGDDDKVVRASELYMNHPRYPEELSLSHFLKAPFVAAEYMGAYPAESKDFKVWCNWLQDKLGIQTTPKVAEGMLAPEFSTILRTAKTAQLLRFLREYWPDVRDRIIHSPPALEELRAVRVTCKNGANESLESTFLATSSLKQYVELPFLPVRDPDSEAWHFLEHLGVSMKLDGMYSLKRLIRLSTSENAQLSDVDDMYKQLEARFDEGDNMKAIREAFKKDKLIYCYKQKEDTTPRWLGFSDVVWVAPVSVRLKVQLQWQYPHLKRFFIAVGVSADCPPDILLEEIKPIAAEWKNKTITNEIYKQVSAILLDIDKVLFMATQRTKPIEMGWLYALRDEAIFPVHSPDLGLTLLSATSDTFYLPDRSGFLAQLFANKVPVIANPMLTNRPMRSLQLISFLLNHDEFKAHLRPLDHVVKTETTTEGERVQDDILTASYSNRVQLIQRLLYGTIAGRQSRVILRKIVVYTVDSVNTTYTIGNEKRSIPDELAVELEQDHTGRTQLVVIIGRSCDTASRDFILTTKIAQLLNLETASVHLALHTPIATVETMFTKLRIVSAIELDEEEFLEDWGRDSDPNTLFSLDRPTAPPDLSEIFSSAEQQLRVSGFRTLLSKGGKYRMDYKSGALDFAEAGITFKASSFAAPIHIPSTRSYPTAGYGSSSYESSSSMTTAIIDGLGEFFVYEGLRSNLPGFGTDNWTSKLRGKFPGNTPFTGYARSTMTYADTQGKMTEYLYGPDVRDAWGPQWPTYFLDVKTTTGPMSDSFKLSSSEFRIAADLTIGDPKSAPAEIYCVVRVADIKQSSRSFRIFPDPHRLFYDKKIRMTSYSSTLSIVA